MCFFITCLLMIGGIGFIMWNEIFFLIILLVKENIECVITDKIDFMLLFFFIFINTILLAFERNNTLIGMNEPLQWINSFFYQ